MFKFLEPFHTEDSTCSKPVDSFYLCNDYIEYYDKDGFELTELERHYYFTNGWGNHLNKILNHDSWQQPWFELQDSNFILDHCMVLQRCDFTGEAREQLQAIVPSVPKLVYLLRCPKKWGLDFNLDFISTEGDLIEVLHIEFDTLIYEEFLKLKEKLEYFILSTDWNHSVKYLQSSRDKWEHLKGFAQNDWKARQLGFDRAEVTLKAI